MKLIFGIVIGVVALAVGTALRASWRTVRVARPTSEAAEMIAKEMVWVTKSTGTIHREKRGHSLGVEGVKSEMTAEKLKAAGTRRCRQCFTEARTGLR